MKLEHTLWFGWIFQFLSIFLASQLFSHLPEQKPLSLDNELCGCVFAAQSRPTLCAPVDRSPPGSPVISPSAVMECFPNSWLWYWLHKCVHFKKGIEQYK